jgi:hypothetical protein
MIRRLASLVAVLTVLFATLAFTAAPAVSAPGDHAALYNSNGGNTGYMQLRSVDELPASYTIYVRAAQNVYLPARLGVLLPQSQVVLAVPAPAAGTGAMYIVNFALGGNVFLFHPDEWIWDF